MKFKNAMISNVFRSDVIVHVKMACPKTRISTMSAIIANTNAAIFLNSIMSLLSVYYRVEQYKYILTLSQQ